MDRTARARRAAVVAALCAGLACAAAAAQTQKPRPVALLDRIVAVVNDEAITRIDLEERVRWALAQLREQGTVPPPREVLERQVLEQMINRAVQLRFAKETGMRVDDAELDRAIQRIAEEHRMSVAQLRETLARDGVPFERFREDIRAEIVIARLREREVDNKIVVTEAEIDGFLAQEQARGGANEEFNLSHILVAVPENASPEQIQERRARAERARSQLLGGADFRQVAAAFSDAPDALQGGAMGWRGRERLPTLFLEAVEKMKAGEVSEILRSANGFHILRLNDRRGTGGAPVMRQTRARHILIRTNELVSEEEARRRLLALKERLEHNADFAELARLHSEDASASKGGDLGWLLPGDTVPEFERTLDRLKPGEVSDPVKTPFGFHLIQVLERREAEVPGDRRRLSARLALRARKSDEAYQEWVRQLRDQAYVEIRLEESRD
jgi:peptidyl-prolyl cis-trans isomerase SurA